MSNLRRSITMLACCSIAGPIAAGLPAVLAMPAHAQRIEARRIPNAAFVRVEMIKFKPGGEDRAFELEDKYIIPAWRLTGLTPPREIHTQTGPWDRIYVYALRGGLADMEWQVSQDRASLLNAVAQVAGGNARALQIMSEWDMLVERREVSIGHEHPAN